MMAIQSMIRKLGQESIKILSLIQKHGPITKQDLTLRTNLPLSTLNRFMLPLEDQGLILPISVGESSGGRKPMLYDVNPKAAYTVGVDISRMYTNIVIIDFKMNIIFKTHFKMDPACTPQYTVEKTISAIYEGLSLKNIEVNKVSGIGIGAVGPIDLEKGIILNPTKFPSYGWLNVDLKTEFEQKTGFPALVDNGANCAVLAEYLYGIGRGVKSLAYFNCGIGIRTGIITDGNMIRALKGVDEVFGHMVINVDGELCSCGNFGCIECYSSAEAVLANFTDSIKKGRTTSVVKSVKEIELVDICMAAEQNDELAREVITNAAVILGSGLANYINLLAPSMVIMSGPLISSSDLFYKVCTEVANKRCFLKDVQKIPFNKGGNYKDDAIAFGAACRVVEDLVK